MSNRLKIGQEVLIHGYIDEIRKDTVIIRNEGGYFGTVQEEISVKPQEPKTGWIPCSEKMPEKDTDILAYVKGVGVAYQRVMWIDDYTGEWVRFAGGSGYKDEVIAWMPLPTPYKPQEREGDE